MTNWDEFFMGMAEYTASRSKDSTKVGAVLVGDNNAVLLTAYNGPPAGVADIAARFVRPAKYLWASHAEQNLVAFAARNGVRTMGCGVVVTHMPCASCARSLVQAGIRWVKAGKGSTSMPAAEFEVARRMFFEAGVGLR